MPTLPKKKAAKKDVTTPKDIERLQGVWTAIAMEELGKQMPEEDVREAAINLTIKERKAVLKMGRADTGNSWTLELDPTTTPKAIDIKVADGVFLGIYELDGIASVDWPIATIPPSTLKQLPRSRLWKP